MKTFIQTLFITLLSATVAYAAPEKTAPAQNGNITVQSFAEQEVEVKLPNGKTAKKRQPVTKAIPGTEVIYTTRFTNQGKQAAGNIVINNPVPENTVYVGGSAFGENTTITFSVDGKNFNTPDKLIIKTPEGRERTAIAGEYKQIRWTYKGELAPGKMGEIGFRVKLK